MKVVFTHNGKFQVMTPREGARLCIHEGRTIKVDEVFGRWPVAGYTPEWAESESEFVSRIAAKDVPQGATGVQIVADSAIPSDRSGRAKWGLSGNKVIVKP